MKAALRLLNKAWLSAMGRPWLVRTVTSWLLLATFVWLPFWQPLSRLEYDLLAGMTAPPAPAVGVRVAGIDEPSLAAVGRAPPLPRRLHAQVIDTLQAEGAAGLGIDLLLSVPQTPHDDAELARALRGPLPVVLASAEVAIDSSQVAHYRQRVESIFPTALHGNVGMPVDADGVLRRAPTQPDAMWRVLAQSAQRAVKPPPPGALLRYYAPEVPLPYAHYSQLLKPGQLPPGALRGQLILLGQNTPVGGEDQFITPMRTLGQGTVSGVFVHATALINALAGDWIQPAPPWALGLQAAVAVLAVAWLTRRWRGLRAAAYSAALAAVAVAAAVLAMTQGWWWSALPTLAGLALHLNVGAADSYWRERRRRESLRRNFAAYVPATVVDALAANETAPAVSGERRTLTLLFSDLAGFTSASEPLPPEAVAAVLNTYFTRMTQAVHRHGGTLDKFIGDAVMAFWNAPLSEPAHAARALACALDMQAEMQALRTLWQGTPFAEVQLRIGLHTGDAAVGHLGSQGRFTYTAVGDTVNTAARLEGANKAFGTGILLSAATQQALAEQGDTTTLLWLDCVVLAGRATGLDVYTPCNDPDLVALGTALQAHIAANRWEDALACCAAWQARAQTSAPALVAHAEGLSSRLHGMAADAATAPAVPAVPTTGAPFARALDK